MVEKRARLRPLTNPASASTVSSEAPLRVFVSSVMRPETEAARDVCFRVLSTGLYRAWMWEHTPPSPEDPQDAYLTAVENSELVIWLVGAETSSAVEDEISLAIRLGKQLLVFRLPAASRDDRTDQLVRDTRQVAKTADVVDLADLERQLTQSLGDALLRAFRGRPRLERRAAAQALYGRLRGIALTRWLAAGVPLDVAAALFEDGSIGRLPTDLLPTAARPLCILQGELGAGKTLGAVRWLLDAARGVVENGGAPLPVWIGREDATSDLRSSVAEQTRVMGDPWRAGVALVVDGVDERAGELPTALLEAARALIHAHPESRGLITTRPGVFRPDDVSELVAVPLLSAEETAGLINRVFDTGMRPLDVATLPPPIRDAVRRPLFALLVGGMHATSPRVRVRGTGQLIERLVVSALGTDVANTPASTLLLILARESIDAGGRAIARRDLGDQRVVDEVLRSRLVTPVGDGLGFALPVLRDWFGAQSIEQAITPVGHIIASEQRLERWRYALYVAAATLPRATVNGLLSAVAGASPGLASNVIDEAAAPWRSEDETAPPAALNLGRWYLDAVGQLSRGIGKAAMVVFPWGGRDHLPRLAVAGDEQQFMYAWLREDARDGDDLVEVPLSGVQHPPQGVLRATWTGPSHDPIWPWKTARNDLRQELSAALKARAFFVQPMRAEATWLAATWLVRRGSVLGTPVPAESVREALARQGASDAVMARDRVVPLFPLRGALQGATELRCPYPDRDEPLSSLIWSGFSDTVLLDRARLVYETAIEIYDTLVREWFAGLRARLPLAQLLPARLVGTLDPGTPDSGLGMTYRWEPLPRGTSSRVEIALGEHSGPQWADLDPLRDRIRLLRPEAPWLGSSITQTALNVFDHDPATRLAFDWLGGELRHLGWST